MGMDVFLSLMAEKDLVPRVLSDREARAAFEQVPQAPPREAGAVRAGSWGVRRLECEDRTRQGHETQRQARSRRLGLPRVTHPSRGTRMSDACLGQAVTGSAMAGGAGSFAGWPQAGPGPPLPADPGLPLPAGPGLLAPAGTQGAALDPGEATRRRRR